MATVTLRPDGDSSTYDSGAWTITAGSDTGTAGELWSYIEEDPADDTGYIKNNDTVGSVPATDLDRQAFTLGNMPGGTVTAVEVYYRARSNFNGGAIVPFVRSGGVDYDGSSQSLTNAFQLFGPVDFTSVVSWTDTLVNSMELGFRKNAFANNEVRVSQAYVVITYTAAGTPFDLGTATAVLTFGASGTLISIQQLTASTAMAFGATATLNRLMGLTGTSAIVFGASAPLNRIMGLTGSSALTFGATATLSQLMGMSGTSAIVFNATGDLVFVGGAFDLGSASAAMSFGATAALRQVMGLTGASSLSFGATANLRQIMGIAGSSSLTFLATADISSIMALTGSASMSFVMVGTLLIPLDSIARSRPGLRGTMGRVDIWVPVHSRSGVRRA